MSHDPVTAPSHYTVYPVQPIAITRHLGFCLGNAVKYVLRAPHKGGVEDLKKALQYLEWEKECPQPGLELARYKMAEQALDAILDYLACNSGAYDSEQAAFLDALDGYMAFRSPSELEHARKAVEKMLWSMEGW